MDVSQVSDNCEETVPRLINDLHDGVNPRQLLKHLEATANDESPASWTMPEDA